MCLRVTYKLDLPRRLLKALERDLARFDFGDHVICVKLRFVRRVGWDDDCDVDAIDVVITSYGTLSSEHATYLSSSKSSGSIFDSKSA